MSLIRWRPGALSLAVFAMAALVLGASCDFSVSPKPPPLEARGIGISLDLVNGAGLPITLSAQQSTFFVQRLNVEVRQENYPAHDVLSWLQTQKVFSVLDWSGLRQVKTSWELESADPLAYEEIRGHLGAHWMEQQEHTFTLQPVDESGNAVGQPVVVKGEDYTLYRRTALSWSTHQPAKGDDGHNHGDYSQLQVESGGTFTGSADDVYLITVLEGGALDGTAQVLITSVRNDNDEPPPPGPPGPDPRAVAVQSGQAIDLGVSGLGATITFTDTGATQLVQGDRWIVRCGHSDGVVQPPEETIHADRHAMARVFFSVPKQSAPVLTMAPSVVKGLKVTWSADPNNAKTIPVSFVEPQYDYGLQVEMEVAAPPQGRAYYLAGETVSVTVQLKDASGTLLHAPEKFPTFAQFWGSLFGPLGENHYSGIQYFNVPNSGTPAGNGFFGEARLNIAELLVAGPRDKLGHIYQEQHDEFFVHGVGVPEIGQVVYPGFGNPELWQTELPTTMSVELPADAKPGTYVAIFKVSRYYLGERVHRIEYVPFQVGSEVETPFHDKSGNCRVCHIRAAALDRIRHGTKHDRLCVACHTWEHGVIGEHVHAIHFFSSKYVVPRNDCSLCHLKVGSNTRASEAVCSSCHQSIHPGEPLVNAGDDPYQACAPTCHGSEPMGHVRLAPAGEGGDYQ